MADCWQQGALPGSQWIQDSQPYVPSSTLRDFMSAFPKPRLSGRITKPRSAGNSPSSAGRRRTTTMPHSSPMYPQLPSQDYQTSLNAALLASAIQSGRRSRPISWHPASRQPGYSTPSHYYPFNTTMNSRNLPVTQACPQPMQAMTGTLNDAGMLQSYAPSDFPTMQQNLPFPMAESHLPMQESSYLQASNPQFDGASWDGPTPGFPSYVHPGSNDWSFDMVSMNQSISSVGVAGSNYGSVSSPGRLTEPATPDFLPRQQFGDDAESQSVPTLEKPDAEDELVGMGLYNNPDTFSETSLYGLNGKGLKLEETFTPSPDNEADDNDEEDDDQQDTNEPRSHLNSASQTQRQSNSHCKQPSISTESMMQKSFFFDDNDDPQQGTMTESRPSFNFGATSCMNMNYGYGWI
ncbi:hypothetical protein BDW59DRAFT_141672 [Aspergillus cavernicola]|uniref:Uncharacterized protein n=1 Tax=Aspergillus cavernicola TaxID=176166 RepID=A0ABR4IQK2_9EURO